MARCALWGSRGLGGLVGTRLVSGDTKVALIRGTLVEPLNRSGPIAWASFFHCSNPWSEKSKTFNSFFSRETGGSAGKAARPPSSRDII